MKTAKKRPNETGRKHPTPVEDGESSSAGPSNASVDLDQNDDRATKPSKTKKRKLNDRWLEEFSWFEFREEKMYCKICHQASLTEAAVKKFRQETEEKMKTAADER